MTGTWKDCDKGGTNSRTGVYNYKIPKVGLGVRKRKETGTGRDNREHCRDGRREWWNVETCDNKERGKMGLRRTQEG